MEGYDYSSDNLYFVTTNVHDKIFSFGKIKNGKMILNEFGKIAHEQFLWLNDQYPYVNIHEFVVMPDHVHVLIEINRNLLNEISDRDFVGDGRDRPLQNNADRPLQNNADRPLQNNADRPENNNPENVQYFEQNKPKEPIKIKSLPQLIGAYKTTVSKQIHLIGLVDFKWQRSYHDRIVRNELEYYRIMEYIIKNPENWKKETI
jgi:REP element-mobilizing transposase RayT